MMEPVTRFLSLLVLAAATGCAGGGWTQMKTRRITAYAERPAEYRDTMKLLEYAHSALSTFFPKAEVGTVEVLFLHWGERAEMFGAQRRGFVLPSVPGGGRIGQRNLIVMSEDTALTESPRLLNHLFVAAGIPGAPMWLHEMLERYFVTTSVESVQGNLRACFGARRRGLPTYFVAMPLERFFAIGWKEYANSEGGGEYASTAYLLGNFIFHGDAGAHLAKLPVIFRAAGQGTPGPQIITDNFPGMTLAQLQQRMTDFASSVSEQKKLGRCPLPIPISPDHRPDESSPVESPMAPQEIDQLIQALKRLPHGDRFPTWYPAEMVAPKS
jgi:hypothetical protein